MPQKFINDKVAVEKEEICIEYWDKQSPTYKQAQNLGMLGVFWRTYDALKVELWRYKDKPYGIKRLMLGGNGRRLLVDFDTLPRAVQEFLGDPRVASNPLERYYLVKPECVDYYGRFKRLGRYLSDSEQERYVVNASVIEAALAYLPNWRANRISLGGNTRGAFEVLRNEVIDFNNWLKAQHNVTHNLPSNARVFRQTLKNFEDAGYYSVIKDPEGRAVRNASKYNDSVKEILEGLYIDIETKPNYTDVARDYAAFIRGEKSVFNVETGEVFNPANYPQVSDSTIRNWLSAWESRIGTHKRRSGNRQVYMGQYVPHAQMERPEYAGSLITVDDRQPPFWYEKGKRMWFYLGFDAASGAITTFVYGKSKEGIIIEFYRQMVRNYAQWGFGLPYELEAESALNSSFKETFLQPGRMFTEVNIKANNARAKLAERLIGILRQLEKKSPGWIGRPGAKDEANQIKPGKTLIIPYDKLVSARIADIERYNNMPHADHPEYTLWEYFVNMQHPDLKPINWAALLPVLGNHEETSCSGGFVKLQYEKRALAENGTILKGEELIVKLKQIEGKSLDVYWLDGNDGEILKALAYHDGRLVCEIMGFPKFQRAKLEQTEEDKKAMEVQMAYINTVTGYASKRVADFEKIAIQNEEVYDIEDYESVELIDETSEEDAEHLKYNYKEDFTVDAFANYRN